MTPREALPRSADPSQQSRSTRLRGVELPTTTWQDWSCTVRLVVTDPDALIPAATDLRAMMGRVDLASSRFRPDSELSRANAQAGRPVVVSRTLVDLVGTALDEAAWSGGAVDPTLGLDLVHLGYDRDISLVRDDPGGVGQRSAHRPRWEDVRLDGTTGLLTVPAGCALDLGASAKARTADRAAAELHGRYGCDVLVELGGDLAIGGSKDDWQILVAERAGDPGQQVTLGAGGLATSTTTIRRWQRGGREISHLLDPATGFPVSGPWRTVTVAAASATRANTCSTGAIVHGTDAIDWLNAAHVSARLVDRDGRVVTTGGWPS